MYCFGVLDVYWGLYFCGVACLLQASHRQRIQQCALQCGVVLPLLPADAVMDISDVQEDVGEEENGVPPGQEHMPLSSAASSAVAKELIYARNLVCH